MTGVDCAGAQDRVEELALDVVDGEERARLLEHVAGCPACRAAVAEAAAAADAVLLAVPEVQPAVGFEQRVLDRLGLTGRPGGDVGPARPAPARRTSPAAGLRRRAGVLLAAALLVAVAVAGVLAVRLGDGDDAPVVAAMRTPDGKVVGKVVLSRDPDAVLLAVPDWQPGWWAGGPADQPGDAARPAYRLRLTLRDGGTRMVGAVSLDGGGTWGGALTVDPARVDGVAMVDERGVVRCWADV